MRTRTLPAFLVALGVALVAIPVAHVIAADVQGIAAVGSSGSTLRPVVVGGIDGSGNVQPEQVDSLGKRVHGVTAAGGALGSTRPVLSAGMDSSDVIRVPLVVDQGDPINPDANTGLMIVGANDGAGASTLSCDTQGALHVRGSDTTGAAPLNGSTLTIGGYDGAAARRLATDTSGRPVIVGAAANAAAVAGNPVLVAGSDGTNARTIPVGVVGNVAPTGIVMLGGADGSVNARPVGLTFNGLSGMVYGFMVHGIDASDSTTARAIPIDNVDAPSTAYGVYVRPVNQQLGSHANAWNSAAVGAGGTSSALDTIGSAGVVLAFGNTSGASTITLQVSADNSNFYSTTASVAANGNFALSWTTGLCGARYVRLHSSAAVTITASIQSK